MKLSLLGGGGFRVPLVYRALVEHDPDRLIDELVLHDSSAERLAAIAEVLADLGTPAGLRVRGTTDLDDAVSGSAFVFSAIRVGGLPGRVADERTALAHQILGQETTGPGGIAYALRTIPVAMHIAHRVHELAPSAYVINFTNPAGIITEAMQRVLGHRVIGICDTPSGLGARVAGLFDLTPSQVRLDYVGLNHLGWLRKVEHAGHDLLADLLADDARLARLAETHLFGADWLRALGAIPNEYLYYYYCHREALHAILTAPRTRGEFLRTQQDAFYAEVAAQPDRAGALWRTAHQEREATYLAESRDGAAREDATGGGYERVALRLMAAIARDERATMIVNVANGTVLSGLPADAVIEVPCLIDSGGPHPLATASPTGHQLGLMQQVKEVERLTIEAAIQRRPDYAFQALALHPLLDSVPLARQLLADYRAATPELFAP